MKLLLLISIVFINSSCFFGLVNTTSERNMKNKLHQKIDKESTFLIHTPHSTYLTSGIQMKKDTIEAFITPLKPKKIQNNVAPVYTNDPSTKDTVRLFLGYDFHDSGHVSFMASEIKNVTIHSTNKKEYDQKKRKIPGKVAAYVATTGLVTVVVGSLIMLSTTPMLSW